jgi:S1-C subfamily serine protease
LEELWLYGTKIQAEEVPQLQSRLPQVAIDYRRGALLGVGSNTPDGMGPAVVGTVQGVAAAAGILVGDIIQKFENQPVPNFKALTGMIGKHAAGDEVTLEVLRGGQPIEFKLKLGQWETYNF